MTLLPPAVLVLGIADARTALAAAAAESLPVTLLSGEGAAAYAGPLWFRYLVEEARRERPDVGAVAVLDCADRAGDAQGALASGLALVLYTGRPDVAARLAAIAQAAGAALLTERPPALDLRGRRDPLPACREWLRMRGGRP